MSATNANISAAQPKRPKYLFPALTTNTAVAVSATSIWVTRAVFMGIKAVSNTAAFTANTAPAYLGWKDAANVTAVGADLVAFHDTIAAGAAVAIELQGVKFDLANLGVLGTTGDKVLVLYWE